MSNLRGMGSVYMRGNIAWICFYHRGKPHRESSHSINKSKASKLLKRRVAEINGGRFVPDETRLTFDEMLEDFKNDYIANGRRSLDTALFHLKHVQAFFGNDRAVDITIDRGKKYQAQRISERAANATINREVAYLGKMLTLAVDSGKLSRKPKFQMLEENNVRQGFLEHGNFQTLLGNIEDEDVRDLVEYEYLSGWRKTACSRLEWRDIDHQGHTARLRIENSKNKEPWILPLTGRLWEVIQRRMKKRRLDCPFVFHRNGKQVKDFRGTWATACKNSGLIAGRAGVVPHDLRRCAVRNLSRAGVPEQIGMKLTGHKTTAIYRRYRIVDEKDLREATEKLQAHLDAQPTASTVIPIAQGAT